MPPPSFPIRLLSARSLAPSVRELVFEREGGALTFRPGQWLNLTLPCPDGTTQTRSYSIASAPAGTARFELAITRVDTGACSGLLHDLAPGATLQAQGPHGFFVRDATCGLPSLFVATGTGITPLRSMLHAALAQGAREPLWVLFGVRSEADLLYRDELLALAAHHHNVRITFTLSQPSTAWAGNQGYVQTHVPDLWRALSEQAAMPPHLYVCGLERMVKAVRSVVRNDLGVGRDRVHSERYD